MPARVVDTDFERNHLFNQLLTEQRTGEAFAGAFFSSTFNVANSIAWSG
jgi:hypothetical protein